MSSAATLALKAACWAAIASAIFLTFYAFSLSIIRILCLLSSSSFSKTANCLSLAFSASSLALLASYSAYAIALCFFSLILASSKAAFVAAMAFWWSASFWIKAASTAALIDASLSFSSYSSKAFFSASDFAKSANLLSS